MLSLSATPSTNIPLNQCYHFIPISFHYAPKFLPFFPIKISSFPVLRLSNCNKMETHFPDAQIDDVGIYSQELGVAVRAVHMACLLCQIVQENMVSNTKDHEISSKDDNSPVTIAGNFNYHFLFCVDTFFCRVKQVLCYLFCVFTLIILLQSICLMKNYVSL